MTRERLARFRTYGLVLALLLAVATLTTFTLRTTLQLDHLREQSVIEATAAVATEKASRIDRQIIDQDNVVGAIADPVRLPELAERWLPTAKRETPTIRALFVLDDAGNVLGSASRASSGSGDDDEFRRLLVGPFFRELALDPIGAKPGEPAQGGGERPEGELRHLHKNYLGQNYLLSYWVRRWEKRRYVVVAWHDVARIVRETFVMTLADTASAVGRVNVLDEEGRPVSGPPLRAGAFSVSVQFPTTLYNWRVQVTPTSAEAIAERVERRRKLEVLMVGLSGLVVLLGVVTLLVATEKQRRLAALKSDFAANVSHELRTPLSLVRMFGELLYTGRATSEEKRREYAGIVLRESERLSALIDNVLDFAKLEQGKGTWTKTDVDLASVARRVVSNMEARAAREEIDLELEQGKLLLPVHADAHAVELAISNLIDNAIKYGGPGKRVGVRVFREGKRVHVAVDDQGPGVPVEARGRIFERFERGQPTRTAGGEAVRGSGIGLSLVKHVADSHGGKTWVEQRSDAAGATFVLALPVSRGFLRRQSPTSKPSSA